MTRAQLERLLAPTSIAFIGGRALEGTIRNCETLGFRGTIQVVNPRYEELAGYRCYPSVAELPEVPDAAFIGIGREGTIEVVRALAERGTAGCVCLAAGFAEVADGLASHEALVAAAGDMAVIGPNCYGLLNLVDGVALWPDLHGAARTEAGAALIAQSGNITLNATMSARSVSLTHVLSIGNQAVTGFGSYLDVLVDDPRVRAVGLYIEALVDRPRFEDAARRALRRGLPIVALRSGKSPVSARVTANHTASVGSADDASCLDALGVIEVDTPAALLESLKLLTAWGDADTARIAAVGASGGDLALLADRANAAGLRFPPLGPTARDQLTRSLGPLVVAANPLDHHTGIWGRHDDLVDCFSTVMSEDVDVAVLVIDLPREETGDPNAWWITLDALIEAQRRTQRRAAVLSTLPEGLPTEAREHLLAAGVVPLQGLEEGVAALATAARYHRRRTELLEDPSEDDHDAHT